MRQPSDKTAAKVRGGAVLGDSETAQEVMVGCLAKRDGCESRKARSRVLHQVQREGAG
jgi:hypothetical protein